MAASRDDDGSGQEASSSSMEEGRSPREDTPPAPCAAFCGPRACSTLPPNISTQQSQAQPVTEPKRRRLWGLRGLVKMFRRRVRRRAGESVSPQPSHTALRARSTSELAVDIQHSRSSGGPYNQGLSVSHDSVFTPDATVDGHHSHSTPPALAIATRGVNMAELKAALRRRRGDDSGSGDDDPGLPLSPPTSPTTLDVLNHGLKSCSRATQSTCSDGSLLSMGSSENDEPGRMLSDLLKLVIRGERPEGKAVVEVGGTQLQRFHLPHVKLHHNYSDQNSLRHKAKKFGRSSLQPVISSSSSSSSTSSTSTWGTRKSSTSGSSKSGSSAFSPYRRRTESKSSKSSRKGGTDGRKKESKDNKGGGKGRAEGRKAQASSARELGIEDEHQDSFGAVSHHSSKVSLQESRHQVVDHEPVAGAAPLSHQAAFHKISIRPKRTHGAPRMRRSTQLKTSWWIGRVTSRGPPRIGGQRSLPTTPEVNEDASTKSVTPSKVPTAATPSPPTELPSKSLYDEETSPSHEQDTSIERRDSEKRDKEEKKDEPLLQRIFGSVRSGRRRSRGNGDDSRENSVSPLRRGGDQRTSREKRRDSSGSRFSMLGRASSKAHNDSHPLPPSGRGRDPSRERPYKEASSSPPQTPRSSSVEGRLESTSPGQQSSFHVSSYDDRPARPFNGVRKVKSFREVAGQPETQREPIHRKVSSQSNVEERVSVSSKVSRLSASFESLDNENDSKLSQTANSSGTSSTEILSTSPQRSSTDSLTSTQIPGVFIRQHSQNQTRIGLTKLQDQYQQSQYMQQGNQDSGSGPLSLDSSISLHMRDSDEHIRKASSVDHVSYVIGSWHPAKDAEVPEPVVHKPTESKQTLVSKIINSDTKTSEKTSPKQASRSYSSQSAEDSGAQISGTDESEAEGERTPRRPLRKEPSIKRVPPRDVESNPVPEFMRIQLNRVESKGQSVIYDTEQERGYKTEVKDKEFQKGQGESSSLSKDSSGKENSDVSESVIINSKEGKPSSLSKRGSALGKGSFRDTSPSSSNAEFPETDVSVDGAILDPAAERVVLRRPLVSERAPVMERASSVSSQGNSTKNEQPELFKVFARRSFKVKDIDKEVSQESETDEAANEEVASEVSEVTVVPTRAPVTLSTSPVPAKEAPLPTNSTSLTAGHQKPSLNAISFNRKSVGNPALSFCPPPVANTSVIAPGSPKTTVVLLSSNASPQPTNTDSVSNLISTSRSNTNINVSSSSGLSSVSKSITTITTPSSTSIINKAATAPIHGPTVRTSNAVSTTDGGVTVTTPVFSKIISRSSSITTTNDTVKNEQESSPATPPPAKLSVSGRSGSSIIWPPRPLPQEETQPAVHLSHTPQGSITGSQTRKLSRSPSSVSDSEETKTEEVLESKEGPVEVSPLDIGAARRRFMSGGKDRPQAPVTPPTQNTSSVSSPGTPSLMSKLSASVTEARNAAPSFTVTVRTQSPSSVTHQDSTTPAVNSSSDVNVNTPISVTSGKTEHGVVQQVAEDWRVLVRQRREGRLKQTKTPDSEEIIIETRPPVSRNSKVLEMANNFQKLQVA